MSLMVSCLWQFTVNISLNPPLKILTVTMAIRRQHRCHITCIYLILLLFLEKSTNAYRWSESARWHHRSLAWQQVCRRPRCNHGLEPKQASWWLLLDVPGNLPRISASVQCTGWAYQGWMRMQHLLHRSKSWPIPHGEFRWNMWQMPAKCNWRKWKRNNPNQLIVSINLVWYAEVLHTFLWVWFDIDMVRCLLLYRCKLKCGVLRWDVLGWVVLK